MHTTEIDIDDATLARMEQVEAQLREFQAQEACAHAKVEHCEQALQTARERQANPGVTWKWVLRGLDRAVKDAEDELARATDEYNGWVEINAERKARLVKTYETVMGAVFTPLVAGTITEGH